MEAKAISSIQGSDYYLSVHPGEKIMIMGKDEHWYHCINSNGEFGKIPTRFDNIDIDICLYLNCIQSYI